MRGGDLVFGRGEVATLGLGPDVVDVFVVVVQSEEDVGGKSEKGEALGKHVGNGLLRGLLVGEHAILVLALLGFSADIFLGLYDDNKYVNDIRAKFESGDFSPPKDKITASQLSTLRDFIAQSKTVTESALCTVSKIARLEDLEAARYEGAVKWLNQKIGAENANA